MKTDIGTALQLLGIIFLLSLIVWRLDHPVPVKVDMVTRLDAQNDSVRCILDSAQISRFAVYFTPVSE